MIIQITGRRINADPQEIFVINESGTYAFPRQVSPLQTNAQIDASQYSMTAGGSMPNFKVDGAISMAQRFNNRKYIPANIELINAGLAVPTPARFMHHLKNVNLALNGEGVLYDACGKLIEGKRLIRYAKIMNSNCGAWLNAGFPKGRGFKNLDLATITGLDSKGEPVVFVAGLEDCLEHDCWADLESLNKQGMPTKKAPIEKYEPGKTVYFWTPREDAVAWFYADSYGAFLDCYRYPDYRDDALGVFASAEGTSVAKNLGFAK